jgi:hypothetical protein
MSRCRSTYEAGIAVFMVCLNWRILHKIKESCSRLRVVWWQVTQLWKLTDLSTKLVINRQRTPFNKYQHQIDQAFWFFFVQQIVQLLGFSIFWSCGWKRELWKLFQKRVMHTILDIHVCIAKFKIQIEKTHCFEEQNLFFQRKSNMVWSSQMLCVKIWTAGNYRWYNC